ncbi:TetR/AcrR family transcriptional regulator [Pseudonocardia halophobica]|uniref:TetR/AcrR family transcriptional regulator n=1 Tax=Pseudonocardia halophobica TaxID=29401 RepID=UPI003D8CBD98
MADTRERLLAAAASVFAARGYNATAVQDVAEAVGIQKSSVYKHFRSKEELLVGCLTQGHALREEVLDHVAALASGPEDRLREYVRRYVVTMLGHRELSAVFAREWVHLSEPHRTADLERRRIRRHVPTELVREAAREGVDATMVATYLKGALHSTLDWYREAGPDPLPAFGKRLADLGCALVAGAPSSTGPVPVAGPRSDRSAGVRAPLSRRDAIDDAALRTVRRKGFAATTIQDVAGEAGVLKGSIYHYVQSKDELLMRIFEAAHLELTTIVGTVAQLDALPAEQLCALVRLQVGWFLDNLDQAVVLFREWPFLTGANRALVAERRRGLERFAARLFEQACAAGEITAGAGTGATVRFALGAANAVSTWYRPDGPWPAAHVAAAYAQLTSGLLHRT